MLNVSHKLMGQVDEGEREKRRKREEEKKVR